MPAPTTATVKRLFALSGNVGAFPNCRNPNIDGDTVIGEVCHIKGQRPGAPRHDPVLSEAELHCFENLILMCPIHHKVIDDDPGSYTVERLTEIKQSHEQRHADHPEPSEQIANQFAQTVADGAIVLGSVIYTNQQMGGQVAHSITNIGLQPRRLSPSAAATLVDRLRLEPPLKATVSAVLGDGEAYQFASQLKNVLEGAGWTIDGVNQSVYVPAPQNLTITTPSMGTPETVDSRVITLGKGLARAGLKVAIEHGPKIEITAIIVGSIV